MLGERGGDVQRYFPHIVSIAPNSRAWLAHKFLHPPSISAEKAVGPNKRADTHTHSCARSYTRKHSNTVARHFHRSTVLN